MLDQLKALKQAELFYCAYYIYLFFVPCEYSLICFHVSTAYSIVFIHQWQ